METFQENIRQYFFWELLDLNNFLYVDEYELVSAHATRYATIHLCYEIVKKESITSIIR